MSAKLNGILGAPKPARCIFSFVTPTESEKISYAVNQQHICSALQHHRWFREGTLIKTFEKGGVSDVFLMDGEATVRDIMYPVIHFVNVPSNQPDNAVQLLHANCLGSNYSLQQGLYTKIKQFKPFPENELLDDDENESRAYIAMGFKTLENTFNDMLEEMWKDWTGARAIYLNLPDELALSQVNFYRRVKPNSSSMFMYILTVQCENVTKKNGWMLLDYVQRLRVEKMMGYMSAYRKESDANDGSSSNFSTSLSHLNAIDIAQTNGFMPIDI